MVKQVVNHMVIPVQRALNDAHAELENNTDLKVLVDSLLMVRNL